MTSPFFRRNPLPIIGMAVGAIGLGAFAAMAATPVAAQPYDPKVEADGVYDPARRHRSPRLRRLRPLGHRRADPAGVDLARRRRR